MNRKHFKTLFSVLLCASTLFSGCNSSINQAADNGQSDNPPPANPPAATPVEGKLSNYLSWEYEKGWDDMRDASDTLLNKNYGTLIETNSDCLYVFKKVDKDFVNNVTETYTVYNARLNKVVLEKTNTYPDANYGSEVHEDKCKEEATGECWCERYTYMKRQPTEIDVEVETKYVNGTYINYILVQTDTYTEISEDFIKEERLLEGYQCSTKWEVFDAHGQAVAESTLPFDSWSYDYNQETGIAKAVFGDTVVLVDVEEDKMIETWHAATESKHYDYDYANDQYYYYLHTDYGFGSVEVYNKENALVARYEHSMDNLTYNAQVLQSGDVLIQTLGQSQDDSYDLMMEGLKLNVDTFILDVETNKLSAVEWDYYIVAPMTASDLDDNMSFTENVVNVAAMQKMTGNGEMEDGGLVFFDNSLNVQFAFKKLIPEQQDFDISILKTGDYLVDLITPIEDAGSAIVTKNGKVRCYVPYGADIVEDRIVIKNDVKVSVFDFDLNCIFELDMTPTDSESTKIYYTYQGRVGHDLVYVKTTQHYDYENYIWEDPINEIYTIDLISEYGYGSLRAYGTIVDLDESYVLFFDEDEGNHGKYKLYNADFECVLVTENEMNIYEYDGNYVVTTWLEGNELVYVFAYGSNTDEGGLK